LIPYHILVKIAKQDAIQVWKQKFKIDGKERIGIFAKNISSTLQKEGVYRMANAQEIKDAELYLLKNRGIRIRSKKYKSIDKIILKQCEIPTNAAVSKNKPQARIVIDKNRR
jgi:hypothetical protein